MLVHNRRLHKFVIHKVHTKYLFYSWYLIDTIFYEIGTMRIPKVIYIWHDLKITVIYPFKMVKFLPKQKALDIFLFAKIC